ncbi:uncharacterized protein [Drosophila takahashii]|uniref:uncharacterized protein n=1 Tax=Drosophila takahashii TaxID=29030 RepID=UPI001CF7F1DF|nr:uncharacterized protein LOC108056047 [Drosophila takahashii]
MFKYLAGIFAKPRNDYVDGRLTTPLAKKLAVSRPPQPRISLKTIMNGCRMKKNSQVQRSPRKCHNFQLDPISYIVDVAADSSSSLDEKEKSIPELISDLETKPLEDQDKEECGGMWPVPPPVSRVQSWTGPFNAKPFNNQDDLSIDKDEDPMGWEMVWLPEEYWSADSEPEVTKK